MISTVDRLKRAFAFIVLFFLCILSGAGILEQSIEFAGGLTLLIGLMSLLYLPFSWLLKRFKYLQFTSNWISKEIWVVLGIIGTLGIIGILNALLINPPFAALFIIPFFTSFFLSILHYRNGQIRQTGFSSINKKSVLNWAFGCFTIGTFLILIILDHNDLQEVLIILGLLYFPTLFYLVLRWIFRQIRLIINLKNEQAKTELLHLKSQVNPHFFFNMLNNLYGLVGKDATKARELILKLSDMMRYSIYEGQKGEVTLEAEMDYLKNYIELHQMRYHKAIEVHFEKEIDQAGIKVMPLLFIILLENAFKHGVEKLRKHAYVTVNIQAKTEEIYFSVINNFDDIQHNNNRGIGLQNLKRRLELVYPEKHKLSFSINQNVYRADLLLKLRK